MTEDAFLRTLQQVPDDDTTRRIYADWLEEQGDQANRMRAAYLRLDLEVAAMPEEAPGRARLVKRRQRLARQIEPAWLAVVSKVPIELCEFEFECPRRWEELTPVDGSTMERFCTACQQTVYYCPSIEVAREHARLGECVAIDARVVRKEHDLLVLRYDMLLGRLPVDFRERRRRRDTQDEGSDA